MGRTGLLSTQIVRTGNKRHLSKTAIADRARAEAEGTLTAGRPRMPKHLSAEAVDVWRRTCRVMAKRKTLTADSGATLEIYAEVSARWIRAKHEVESRGQVIDETRFSRGGAAYVVHVPNPSLKIQCECEKQLLTLARALGLSPDTREKVRVTRLAPQDEPIVPGSIGDLYPEFFTKDK